MNNIIKKISNWLFGKNDALNTECAKVYTELEEKYGKEKPSAKYLSPEEYISTLTEARKELLIENKEVISKKIDEEVFKEFSKKKETKSAEKYVNQSTLVKPETKTIEINSEKAKTIKQNKKRKYTKKK